MDKVCQAARSSLIDARSEISHKIQRITVNSSKEGLGRFLVSYCQYATLMMEWMSDWNNRMQVVAQEKGDDSLAIAFKEISDKLFIRSQALKCDQGDMLQWVVANLGCDIDLPKGREIASTGMKKFRHLFEECEKRKEPNTWLFIMSEVERLRIIHGFTLVSLCSVLLGKQAIRRLSHILLQHRQSNKLFDVCEVALSNDIKLHPKELPDMVEAASVALDAYGLYIDDCYETSRVRVEAHAA